MVEKSHDFSADHMRRSFQESNLSDASPDALFDAWALIQCCINEILMTRFNIRIHSPRPNVLSHFGLRYVNYQFTQQF